jgi:hypothetical protein
MRIKLLLSLAVLIITANASATELGDPGTVTIGGHVGASYLKHDASPQADSAILFNPTIDAFVAKNISLGLSAGVARMSSNVRDSSGDRYVHSTAWDVSPRVGVFVPISDRAALWPYASVGYARQHFESFSGSALRGTVGLQLTYAVSDHLYLRFSPGGLTVQRSFVDGSNATAVQAGVNGMIGVGVGGWF